MLLGIDFERDALVRSLFDGPLLESCETLLVLLGIRNQFGSSRNASGLEIVLTLWLGRMRDTHYYVSRI